MNNLDIEIRELINKTNHYLVNGKYKLQFTIITIILSILAIYTLGKRFGELIYFIKN